MKPSLLTLLLALSVAAVGSFAGFILMQYSEADDAPGGMLLGLLVIVGALVAGYRIVRNKA
ncbi:MAG TPA: hypothetical protein VKZ41_07645 [Gemmatimonadales bacterium]|nr:hypothetical protein [Gemmatimonadales bacterium]